MRNPKQERTSTPYACPVAGKTVRINRIWSCLLDGNGAEVARAPSATSCSNQDHCIVATHHTSGTTYDWDKCAFLEESKR